MRRLSLLCCAVMLVASCSSSSGGSSDGSDGSDGSTSITGSTDTDGSDGSTSNTGADGSDGSTGITGTDGSTETTGSDGSTGATGSDGTEGTDGTTGATGTDGSTGTTGITGTDGSTSSTGSDGSTGTDGSTGATGTDGVDDTDGSTGIDIGSKLDEVDCVTIAPYELRTGDPTLGSIAVAFGLYTCDGAGIVDLKASDIILTENDALISPSESSATLLDRTAEAYVTLVLDNSPSVATNGALEDAVQGALDFADQLFIGDTGTTYVRVAFFSKSFTVQQDFTNDLGAVKAAINSLLTDTTGVNTTNLYGALIDAVTTSQSAQQARKSAMQGGALTFGQIVVFTDGSDQAALKTLDEATTAVEGTQDDVFMISLGGEVSEDVLAQLGKNGAYGATDASALTGLFTTVAQFLTSRKNAIYVLGYCTPKLAGQHELTLSIEGKGVSLPTDFDASGFDADGPTCSSAAFASACDGKGCGGLLCGGCVVGNHSTCGGSGQCNCLNGWGGLQCETCPANFTGLACDTCANSWTGAACDVCPANYTGASCDTCAG
ncbi:MAG: VWA domain-containing protein, partial [Myxococcota bacterium]|nr:VWA domain-containing protein [Myxococcota bacterium]